MTQIQEDTKYIQENFSGDYLQLKCFLETNKLLIFFLTPKMGGKSTYIGFLKELFPNKFSVISAGDLVREIQTMTNDGAVAKLTPIFGNKTNSVLIELKESNVKQMVSDEILYKLLLSSIQDRRGNSLILDGFPRTMEQLAMSWDLATQLAKQNFVPFVLNITLSDAVLDKRMASRRVCPKCGLVGNIDTLHTLSIKSVGYNDKTKEYFLTCDKCQTKMVKKSTDTELSEMAKRREVEKQVYAEMVKRAKEKNIKCASLRTDILIHDFVGDDKMLNLSNSYQLDKLGQISSKTVRFVARGEAGDVYAYHPRYVTGRIVKALAKQFFPIRSYKEPLLAPKDNLESPRS